MQASACTSKWLDRAGLSLLLTHSIAPHSYPPPLSTFISTLAFVLATSKHQPQLQVHFKYLKQTHRHKVSRQTRVKMHGTDCPKCGASSDGSSKTCGSCGAVRFLPFSHLLLLTPPSSSCSLSKFFALEESRHNITGLPQLSFFSSSATALSTRCNLKRNARLSSDEMME